MRLSKNSRFEVISIAGFVLGFSLLATPFARGDEPFSDRETLVQAGYHEVSWAGPASDAQPIDLNALKHALHWPVKFVSPQVTLGNVMATFQPFRNPPYWHGGLDMLVSNGERIIAPIAGRLEGGHYSYTGDPNGHKKKFWSPWPATGDPTYFELALVTDQGLRFEFHHVDRAKLPQRIVDLLNQGGGMIQVGEHIGNAVYFMEGYHHVHYNIYLPDGTTVNPEFVTDLLPDTEAPRIEGVYAVDARGSAVELKAGASLPQGVQELVVATRDHKSGGIYDHAPARAGLFFEATPQVRSVWDFSQTLLDSQGRPADLREYYASKIRLTDGRTLTTDGGYGKGLSLVRFPIPAGAGSGKLKIRLEDPAGNASEFLGKLVR